MADTQDLESCSLGFKCSSFVSHTNYYNINYGNHKLILYYYVFIQHT